MKPTAEHFKILRDLFTLFEKGEYPSNQVYAELIRLKIEEIKLDGAEEMTERIFHKTETTKADV